MPPRKQVPSLLSRSCQIMSNNIRSVCDKFLAEEIYFDGFTDYVQTVGLQLSNVLPKFQHDVGMVLLEIADKAAEAHEPKQWTEKPHDHICVTSAKTVPSPGGFGEWQNELG